MRHKDLFLLSYIFSSDDDGDCIEDIYAGYDDKFNLVVLIEHMDSNYPEHNCCAYAIINKDDSYLLAKQKKVAMTDLPSTISRSIADEYYDIANPSVKQTQRCFREILDCLDYDKCRYKLVRTRGADGYCCV